jgi:hypothetical protein
VDVPELSQGIVPVPYRTSATSVSVCEVVVSARHSGGGLGSAITAVPKLETMHWASCPLGH